MLDKIYREKNQNDKRASVYLEFYLLIISLPLPFKMNYQAHVKKKKNYQK